MLWYEVWKSINLIRGMEVNNSNPFTGGESIKNQYQRWRWDRRIARPTLEGGGWSRRGRHLNLRWGRLSDRREWSLKVRASEGPNAPREVEGVERVDDTRGYLYIVPKQPLISPPHHPLLNMHFIVEQLNDQMHNLWAKHAF